MGEDGMRKGSRDWWRDLQLVIGLNLFITSGLIYNKSASSTRVSYIFART